MPLKKKPANETPLAMTLARQKHPQATPLDVFKLARKRFLEGKTISIGELANTLCVSRGTVYRWVGSKELLLDEIFWSLSRHAFERAIRETPGSGIEHVVGVHKHFITAILSFSPMQEFIRKDPNYAMRMLTNRSSGVSKRVVQATADHLRHQEAAGHLRLYTPAEELAEFFILANQAIMYSDSICGRSPAIEKACTLIRMLLLSGRVPEGVKQEPDQVP
jgi:AcrR family transcriptional regulator